MEWCARDGAALCSPDDLARVGTRFSNYEITDVIGVGGMGVVYKGLHTSLRKTVALKILNETYGRRKNAHREMLREAQAASRIRNPHIVDVTDFGTTDEGAAYLVMEYLEGESLSALLMRDVRIAVPRAVTIIRQVAGALDSAHQAGIIHRDLKPENVFLLSQDRSPPSASKEREPAGAQKEPGSNGEIFAKLLDFGLAKVQDMGPSTRTKAGMIAGTPYYMSPEQAQNKPVDPRSDIYSLGVLFYHMVTGVLPFTGNSSIDILMAHIAAPVGPPHRVWRGVDKGTSQVILKCLKKDPSFRFQDMGELCDALSACGTGGFAEPTKGDDVDMPDHVKGHDRPTQTSDLMAQVLGGAGPAKRELSDTQAPLPRPSRPSNPTISSEFVEKVFDQHDSDESLATSAAPSPLPPPESTEPQEEQREVQIIRDRTREVRPLGTGSVEPKLLPVGAPQHQILTDPVVPAPPAAGKSHRAALIAVVMAVCAVAVGVVVYLRDDGDSNTPTAGAVTAGGEAVPEMVRIRIDGLPPGAMVFLDGKQTKQPLMLRRGREQRKVAVEAPDFIREERTVVPSENQRLLFSLARVTKVPPGVLAAVKKDVKRKKHWRRKPVRPKIAAKPPEMPKPKVEPKPKPKVEPKPKPKPKTKPKTKTKKGYKDWVMDPFAQ